MAADDLIPETLVQAFREAVSEFREWRKYNGPEPNVELDSQPYSLAAIAELASRFDDPMPEDIIDLLWQIEGFGGNPTGKTFAIAAPYLFRVYTEHRRLVAKRRE